MRLQNYMNDDITADVITLLAIIDESHRIHDLNESFLNSVGGISKKVVSILRKGKAFDDDVEDEGIDVMGGLFPYLKGLGVGGSQMIFHAVNAYYNKDERSKQKVKELMGSIDKDDLIDGINYMDAILVHLLAGPLHVIETITGWVIIDKVNQKLEPKKRKVRQIIRSIKDLKKASIGAVKDQLDRYVEILGKQFMVNVKVGVREETVGADVAAPDIKIGDTVRRRKKKKKKKRKGDKDEINTNNIDNTTDTIE
ncbi:MAG: hypothetical protein KAS32_03455 [Candidatus Peribacteraceae bacterium]|nr:hypothetical protein [Candidatus Peribacteraceae bacterium]